MLGDVMARNVCVKCGKPYGHRAVTVVKVTWDTPLFEVRDHRGNVYQAAAEPPAKPPPYRGNGRVVRERFSYLSADTNKMVMEREVWDGESWIGGYEPFCTLRCALAYAREAHKVLTKGA